MRRVLLIVGLLMVSVPAWAQQSVSVVNMGATTAASCTGDVTCTLMGHVRFLDKMFNDVWDSVNHRLNIAIANGSSVDGSGNAIVVGNVAHDAVDSGSPIKVGFKALAGLSAVTLVSSSDRSDAAGGVDGVLYTRPYAPLEDLVSGNASNTDGSSTSLIAAAGSGVKMYLTGASCTNTSASNIYVELKDGSTAKYTLALPANGGNNTVFTTPLPGSANTAWNFDPSAAATTVICSAVGFKSKI